MTAPLPPGAGASAGGEDDGAASAPRAIAVLAGTPAVLRDLLGGQADAVLNRDAGDGWSPRDVLAHLLSATPLTLVDRVERLLAAPGAAVPLVDPDATLAASGYRERPAGWLLYALAQERRAAVARLRALDAAALRTRGRLEGHGAITVANVIHQAAHHDLLHVRQAAEMLDVAVDAGRGGLRSL